MDDLIKNLIPIIEGYYDGCSDAAREDCARKCAEAARIHFEHANKHPEPHVTIAGIPVKLRCCGGETSFQDDGFTIDYNKHTKDCHTQNTLPPLEEIPICREDGKVDFVKIVRDDPSKAPDDDGYAKAMGQDGITD